MRWGLNGLAAAVAGDWVDRGAQGFEVVMALWAFKIAHPGSVYLNRGNHEDRDMNSMYFFEQEASTRFLGMLFHVYSLK
jgi:serine/threonine-protein phosphatase 5